MKRALIAALMLAAAGSATAQIEQRPYGLFVINEAMDVSYPRFSPSQDEYYTMAPGMAGRLYLQGREGLSRYYRTRCGLSMPDVNTTIANPFGVCTPELGGRKIEIIDAAGGVSNGCIAEINRCFIRFEVPKTVEPQYGSTLKQIRPAVVRLKDTTTNEIIAAADVPVVPSVPGLYLADPEQAAIGKLLAPIAVVQITRPDGSLMVVTPREPIDMSAGKVSLTLLATGIRNYSRPGLIRVKVRAVSNDGTQLLEADVTPESLYGYSSVGADNVVLNLSQPAITDLARQADRGEIFLTLNITDQSVPLAQSNPVYLVLANLVPSRATGGSRGPGGRRDTGGRTIAP